MFGQSIGIVAVRGVIPILLLLAMTSQYHLPDDTPCVARDAHSQPPVTEVAVRLPLLKTTFGCLSLGFQVAYVGTV